MLELQNFKSWFVYAFELPWSIVLSVLQYETCYGHLICLLFVECKWFVCVCGGGNVFISAKNVYFQRFFTVWFVGKRLHKFCKKCPISKCTEYYCGNILIDKFSIVQRSCMKTSSLNWREIRWHGSLSGKMFQKIFVPLILQSVVLKASADNTTS